MTRHPPVETSLPDIPFLENRGLKAGGSRIILHVRVTAKAGSNRIGGLVAGADGRHRLKIAVTAPPSDGAANAAVVKAVARSLGLPKSALNIVAGPADRNKQIEITGDDPDARLSARLSALAHGRGS